MLIPLNVQPGLYTENSDRTALNRWKTGLNVRFFKANPEKAKGWEKLVTDAFVGVCRAMVSWTTLTFTRLVALGTSSKLYLFDTSLFFDITPIESSGTLSGPFATTISSPTVRVTDTSHGRNPGDFVHFSGAVSVGGITPNGAFQVSNVVDTDHYDFVFTSNATSTASGGGGASVAYEYEIPVGNVDTILGVGWGTGEWGVGTWGVSTQPSTLQDARIWSLAPWGEDLLASPLNLGIYLWSATAGTNTRATLITQAPASNRRVLVSDQLRIAVSIGSHDGTDPDPMLIRWCDSEDYTEWTPDITNLAGDIRLSQGSRLITGVITRGEIAVISDQAVYAMSATGDDLVFGFQFKGTAPPLLGPNAAIDANGVVWCMALNKFFTYDGQVVEVPCDVHKVVFGEPDNPMINLVQASKTAAAWNPDKSEVIFFYAAAGSNEINRCVGVSTDDKTWWLGTAHCTAWMQKHPFQDTITVPLGCAVATDGNNYVYKQETGVDADGEALPYFLESYDMEIGARSNGFTGDASGQGEFIFKVQKIYIDLIRCAGRHKMYLKGRKTPTDRQWVKGPKWFTALVRHVDMKLRSRQIALRVESSQLGADISLGGWRLDVTDEGKK